MPKLLDHNYILMYSAHSKGKSVKSINKIIANDTKSYISCLNKLVDEYNNTYCHSVGKKPIDTDYFPFTEEIKLSHKAP